MQIRRYSPALFFQCIYFSLYLFLMQFQAAALIAYNGYNKIKQGYTHYTYYYQKRLVKFFFLGIHITATAYKRLTNKFEYTITACNPRLNSLLVLCMNKDMPVDDHTTKNE